MKSAKPLECGDLAPLSQLCILGKTYWTPVIRSRIPKLGKRRQVAALQRLRRLHAISLLSNNFYLHTLQAIARLLYLQSKPDALFPTNASGQNGLHLRRNLQPLRAPNDDCGERED